MNKRSFIKSKRKIGIVWLVSFAVLFFMFLIRSFNTDATTEFTWLLNNYSASLSLIVGVFVMDFKSNAPDQLIEPFYFRLTYYLSLFFFTTLYLTYFLYVFFDRPLDEVLNKSGMYLSPLQGIVVASLGIFFIKPGKEGTQGQTS